MQNTWAHKALVGLAAGLSIGTIGCSSGFQGAQNLKLNELVSQSLMSTGRVATACVSPTGIEMPDACSPTTPTDPVDPVTPENPITPVIPKAPVIPVCSRGGAAAIGATIKSSTNLRVQFVDANGNVACEYVDNSVRDGIINTRTLTLPADLAAYCPSIAAGTYAVRLRDNSSGNMLTTNSDADSYSNAVANLLVSTYQGAISKSLALLLMNLFNNTPQDSHWVVSVQSNARSLSRADGGLNLGVMYDVNKDDTGEIFSSAECDIQASPLVIQLVAGSEKAEKIELTAPLSGIRFDILGQPGQHRKSQISWLTPKSALNNYYLVLPAQDGSVSGIDQMFGDNTTGPDGKTAANGYEALRKFDGRTSRGEYNLRARDGVIDERDAVFSHLRLWSDANGDGIAQASELTTLDDAGLVSISLDYDAHYSETDVYGNKIRMKSAVRTKDGLNHVMYDLWFRIVD